MTTKEEHYIADLQSRLAAAEARAEAAERERDDYSQRLAATAESWRVLSIERDNTRQMADALAEALRNVTSIKQTPAGYMVHWLCSAYDGHKPDEPCGLCAALSQYNRLAEGA